MHLLYPLLHLGRRLGVAHASYLKIACSGTEVTPRFLPMLHLLSRTATQACAYTLRIDCGVCLSLSPFWCRLTGLALVASRPAVLLLWSLHWKQMLLFTLILVNSLYTGENPA